MPQRERNEIKARQAYSSRTRFPEFLLLKCIQDKLYNQQLQKYSRGIIQGGPFSTDCLLRKDVSRQERVKKKKLPMECHNNYLEYMMHRDRWNVVSLSRYSEVRGLFDYPM